MRPSRESGGPLLLDESHEQRGNLAFVRVWQRLISRNDEMERLHDARRQDAAPALLVRLFRQDKPQVPPRLRSRDDDHDMPERLRTFRRVTPTRQQPVSYHLNQFSRQSQTLATQFHFVSYLNPVLLLGRPIPRDNRG